MLISLLQPAFAGGCCGTGGGPVPMRVAPQEQALVGLSVGQSLEPHALSTTTTLGLGVRHGRLQAGLSAPWLFNARGPAGEPHYGVGPGDLRAGVLADPSLGDLRVDLGLGVRVPTGVSWLEADDPYLADVTGVPGVGALFTLGLEKPMGEKTWSLWGEADLSALARGGAIGGVAGMALSETMAVQAVGQVKLQGGVLQPSAGLRAARSWTFARGWVGLSAGPSLASLELGLVRTR